MFAGVYRAVAITWLIAMLIMMCPCQNTPTPENWPTGASISSDSISILKGGYSTVVEFQLYLQGEPYIVEGFNVEFNIVDKSIASFVDGTGSYSTTTIAGRANATIVSHEKTGITELFVRSCNQQESMTINVLGYGSISGFITDTHQHALPGAIVTLYPNAHHNATSGQWEHDPNTTAIDPFVPDNPQCAGNGSAGPAGAYVFSNVPLGTYRVEVDASSISGNDSHRYFAIVDILVEGSATANVVIPGHVVTSTPESTITQTATTPSTASATMTTMTTETTTVLPGEATTQSGNSVLLTSVIAIIVVSAAAFKWYRRTEP